MYQLHRIYCATPWELEELRGIFYDAVAGFNQGSAMQQGVLFVAVSLGNVASKRPFQHVVEENIRGCRHYIQVLDTAPYDGWGPADRNFERDYQFALSCRADAAQPMSEVAVLLKSPACPPANLAEDARAVEFGSAEEFRQDLMDLFAEWLPAIAQPQTSAASAS